MNPTNPHKSLLHRQTTNPYESWGPDSRIPTVYKRFVSWIRFVVRCSKDSFRGFVLYNGVQKIRFVDSFRKTKNLKRFDSFRFGRIRIRIPHPYLKYSLPISSRQMQGRVNARIFPSSKKGRVSYFVKFFFSFFFS